MTFTSIFVSHRFGVCALSEMIYLCVLKTCSEIPSSGAREIAQQEKELALKAWHPEFNLRMHIKVEREN